MVMVNDREDDDENKETTTVNETLKDLRFGTLPPDRVLMVNDREEEELENKETMTINEKLKDLGFDDLYELFRAILTAKDTKQITGQLALLKDAMPKIISKYTDIGVATEPKAQEEEQEISRYCIQSEEELPCLHKSPDPAQAAANTAAHEGDQILQQASSIGSAESGHCDQHKQKDEEEEEEDHKCNGTIRSSTSIDCLEDENPGKLNLGLPLPQVPNAGSEETQEITRAAQHHETKPIQSSSQEIHASSSCSSFSSPPSQVSSHPLLDCSVTPSITDSRDWLQVLLGGSRENAFADHKKLPRRSAAEKGKSILLLPSSNSRGSSAVMPRPYASASSIKARLPDDGNTKSKKQSSDEINGGDGVVSDEKDDGAASDCGTVEHEFELKGAMIGGAWRDDAWEIVAEKKKKKMLKKKKFYDDDAMEGEGMNPTLGKEEGQSCFSSHLDAGHVGVSSNGPPISLIANAYDALLSTSQLGSTFLPDENVEEVVAKKNGSKRRKKRSKKLASIASDDEPLVAETAVAMQSNCDTKVAWRVGLGVLYAALTTIFVLFFVFFSFL